MAISMADWSIALLSALSVTFWQLAKHLALDLPAILTFVLSVIAPIRTTAMAISTTMPGADAQLFLWRMDRLLGIQRRNVLPLLRLSTMLRPNQNRTQHLLLAASNGQSCFVFHILIQPSLSSLMPCIIYSLASSTNISKIYWVFASIIIKRRAALL